MILDKWSLNTKIPGDYILMDKSIQYKVLNFLKRDQPSMYKYHVPSWIVPKHLDRLKQSVESNEHPLYIAKPTDDEYG